MILDMKRLGHPSFAKLDEGKVREDAKKLPVNGVPPEVLQIIHQEATAEGQDTEDKLQPQKAATPFDAPHTDLTEAGKSFAAQRPRAVVAEGRAAADAHDAAKGALDDMVESLKAKAPPTMQTLEVRAGNRLLDQFQPHYWSIAFCFLFKHTTAEPDVANHLKPTEQQQQSRRKKGNPAAPAVGMQAWAGAMQRQVASQFRRDWNFSPTLWNYLFRTMVNLQPNAFTFTTRDTEDGSVRMMKEQELREGIQEIYRNLEKGTYVDINGENKAIKGDMTKLRHVPNLSNAAKKFLMNAEARTRKVPGTHEVRSTMRHQTHAYRVNYGLALFVTFSPSERDACIMLRMARARQGDPAIRNDPAKELYARGKPELDVDYLRLSPEKLLQAGMKGGDISWGSYIHVIGVYIHAL